MEIARRPQKPRPLVIKGQEIARIDHLWPKRKYVIVLHPAEIGGYYFDRLADWTKRANVWLKFITADVERRKACIQNTL